MPPDLQTEVAAQVNAYLASHNEDACWMSGGWCEERWQAYNRLRTWVAHGVIKAMGWRTWHEHQDRCREEIERLCERLRHG